MIHASGVFAESTGAVWRVLASKECSVPRAPYLIVMDADLQHDTSILPRMLDVLRTDQADLVVGSRYAGGGSIGEGFSEMRAAISRWAIKVARQMLHTDVQDLMSGYFGIRRDRFDLVAARLAPSGFKILLDIIASAGGRLRAVELGYTFKQRTAGESKLDTRVALDCIALLIEKTTRGRTPIRFVFFSMNGPSGVVVHLTALPDHPLLSVNIAAMLALIDDESLDANSRAAAATSQRAIGRLM